MFRVNASGQCLTLDIEERNKQMEDRVKGRVPSKIRIQKNLLREPTGTEETNPRDPFNIGLEDVEEDLGEEAMEKAAL